MKYFACSLGLLALVGCNPSPEIVYVDNDAGGAGDGGAGLTSMTTWPLALVPTFSPTTHDYYVRCSAGDNTVTFDTTIGTETESVTTDLQEDQAVVVQNDYWIRCLPHDFPTIAVTGAPATPGYYLVNTTAYAMALDVHGVPVWYARGTSVGNVDSPAVNTISLMPYFTGPYGYSQTSQFEAHALDKDTTTTIRAIDGTTDGHELQRLPNGDYLLFTYLVEPGVDLSGLSSFSSAEYMADCEIQEVDPSGDLVWSWLASDHVDPIVESLEPGSNSINGQLVRDPFHCNSIDVDSSGNLLLSMRHTNSLFYIDKSSGKVLWKMGGTASNKDGATHIQVDDAFDLQHDARFRPNGNISLFDDHGAITGVGVARGVEYSVDHTANTATLVFQFLGSVQAQFEGSFRRYDDGDSVIGWGEVSPDARVVTEIDSNGNEVFDVLMSPNDVTYRAIKVPLSQLDITLLRTTAARW